MWSTILAVGALLVALDSIYLFFIREFFSNQIRQVQGGPLRVNYTAAILCYALLIYGLYHFILVPRRSIREAFLLGLVVYGVYETTSMALLTRWSWMTVLVDTLWGATLFALATGLAYRFIM